MREILLQVILMDHVDWLDSPAAKKLAKTLAKHVAPGGRVIWRSAALCPPYARLIQQAGFEVLPHISLASHMPCKHPKGARHAAFDCIFNCISGYK